MNDLIVTVPEIPSVTFSIDPKKINAIKKEYPLDQILSDLSNKDAYAYVVAGVRACREAGVKLLKSIKSSKPRF